MDLKHENILLDENINIKIADLGFTHKLPDDGMTSFTGCTPAYAPKEVLDGQVPYNGFASDIYSIGTIFYVAFFLRYPEKNARARLWKLADEDLPPLSDNLKHLINSMLSNNPSERPTVQQCLAH